MHEADLDHYERAIDFRSGVVPRADLADAGRQAGAGAHRAGGQPRAPAPGGDAARDRRCSTARAPIVVSSQLLNRQDGEDEYHVTRGRARRGHDPRQARKFDRRVLDPRLQRHDDPDDPSGGEVTLGYRCIESGMTLACAYRHEVHASCRRGRHRTSLTISPSRSSRSVPTQGRPSESRSTSRTTRRAACRPRSSPTDATGRSIAPAHEGPASLRAEQRGVARRLLGAQRHRDRRRPGGAAGRPLEPVPARPGLGPNARAGHRGQGGDRRRVRRSLLLGHRGLRPAVPRLHQPRRRPEAAALPVPHARRSPRPGRGAQPARRALPMAHHQRRGGIGLLRGRHGAVSHQRRHRVRTRAVPLRDRRHRVPRPGGRGDPGRDGPSLRGPGLLLGQRRRARSTSTGSPAPTSTRPS